MEYLVRLAQVHESFRKAELEALVDLLNIDARIAEYSEYVCLFLHLANIWPFWILILAPFHLTHVTNSSQTPFCILSLPSEKDARALSGRSILSKGIYELWGIGTSYEDLRADVERRKYLNVDQYKACSFKFEVDVFQGKQSLAEQDQLIQKFQFLGMEGPIRLKNPEQIFCIFEDCDWGVKTPKRIYLGRRIAGSSRDVISTYSLKKRKYLSTTSMDSELALITANLTHASPGKLFYDPFVGTGSFPIACAHFGAIAMGSDIDGRAVRGKNGLSITTNFQQYGMLDRYLDGFIGDLTHNPLRTGRFLDGIICDPPYGVREGLKVLGSRDGSGKEVVWIDGEAAHLQDGYVPPKKPYSFEAMLDDILDFAASFLVDNGRLSLWMPTANDQEVELEIPQHPYLEIMSVCVQAFNKCWFILPKQ